MAKITIWNVRIDHRHMEAASVTPFTTEAAARKYGADHARERYEDHIDEGMSDDDVLRACWEREFMRPDSGEIDITSRTLLLPDELFAKRAPESTVTDATMFALLCENFDAWDDEEESVKEEHEDLISQTEAFIDAVNAAGGAGKPRVPADPVAAARAAVEALAFARECLVKASAPKTLAKVRLAHSSAKGAVRAAEYRKHAPEIKAHMRALAEEIADERDAIRAADKRRREADYEANKEKIDAADAALREEGRANG